MENIEQSLHVVDVGGGGVHDGSSTINMSDNSINVNDVGNRNLLEFLVSDGDSLSDSNIIGKIITFALIWLVGIILLMTILWLGCVQKRDVAATKQKFRVDDAENNAISTSSNINTSTLRPTIIGMTSLCAIIALTSSILTLFNCEFLVVSYDNANNPNTDYPTSIGVWSIGYPKEGAGGSDKDSDKHYPSEYKSLSIKNTRECYYAILEDDILYDHKNTDESVYEIDISLYDWPIELSRSASIVAAGVGLLGFLLLLCLASCNYVKPTMWIITSLLFLLATIGQGLTLFLLQWELCTKEYDCTMEFGAVTSITATFFWLLALIGTCFSIPPKIGS